MRHIIESQQFDRHTLEYLFALSDTLEKTPNDSMRGRVLASLFYEPSTRTRLSFESAMIRLGGNVISTENAKEFSSAIKGETLEDSIRIISGYADVIALRHFENDAAQRAAAVSSVPVINAGSGAGQHPTQALLDAYTIWKELGRLDGITIALAGDLKHGRTVRSLSYLLAKFTGVKIIFVAPTELRIGSDILQYLDRKRVAYEQVGDLESVLSRIDVLYQTRIQKERFADLAMFERVKNVYRVTVPFARMLAPGAIIMHPLPRVDEIAPEVDALPAAAYFRQARYGLLIRMALLSYMFEPPSGVRPARRTAARTY
jgi:aspartate carbamoyltransferase catalytic subunit